jgi:transcriptional regulator with XRE-family HTH domain
VAHDLVAEVEDGTRTPIIDSADKLAAALGLSPSFLAYGINVPMTESDPQSVGLRLADARSAARMSKAATSRVAGVTRAMVLYIEQGINLPSLATAERLANALDLSPGWLAFGEGPQVLRRRKARSRD